MVLRIDTGMHVRVQAVVNINMIKSVLMINTKSSVTNKHGALQ